MFESKNLTDPEKVFIIYHRVDLDWLFGGAIAKRILTRVLTEKKSNFEITMVPQHYWDHIDIQQMKWANIIMVDFSLPKEQMLRLNIHTNFVWIDHHKSAIEEMTGIDIKWVRSTEDAACKLALEFLDPDKEEGVGIYDCINLLSEYDARHSKNPLWRSDILPYQFGVRHHVELDIEKAEKFLIDTPDPTLIKNLWSIIIENNRIMWKQWMQKSWVIEMARKNTDWTLSEKPYRCLTLLGPVGWWSQVFESVYNPELHDLMVYISYNVAKKEFSVSLYSTKEDIDASELAKQFWGGGHHGAAGFSCKTLPFEI